MKRGAILLAGLGMALVASQAAQAGHLYGHGRTLDLDVDDSTCFRLYTQRNMIFKDAGLCFTRPAAIRQFGNSGCQYDSAEDVPLTHRQRETVKAIVSHERRLRCARDGG